MKIAMIGQRGVPATFGGVERHVEELGARLAADGHEVVVFCRRGYGESEPERYRGMRLVHQHTVDSKHLESFVASATATAATLGKRYDIVHYHAVGPGLFSPVVRALSGARVVQTIHGLDGERAKWGRGAERAAALRDLAQRPRAGPHDRRLEVAPGGLPRAVRPGDRAHRQRNPGGDPASGRGDHRAVGPDPRELRAVGRPPGAREGTRAPAGRVRRRPWGHTARHGRRLEPHRRVRQRSALDGRGGPPRDHGGLRLRRRARGAVLQRRGLRPPLAARGPAAHPPGGGQLRLLHRGERHPAPRRGRRLVGPRRPPLRDRRHPGAHQGADGGAAGARGRGAGRRRGPVDAVRATYSWDRATAETEALYAELIARKGTGPVARWRTLGRRPDEVARP